MQNMQSNTSFIEAKERYAEFRELIYEMAEQEFAHLGIQCREISYSDAMQADAWSRQWKSREKTPIWEWVNQYQICQGKNSIKRFDLAVCANGNLQALCYGMPTKRKLTLKLHTLSRNPLNNPLTGEILKIVLSAAYDYAQLLNCKEIWLMEPMNEKLVTLYKKMGYDAQRNRFGLATHLSLEVLYE